MSLQLIGTLYPPAEGYTSLRLNSVTSVSCPSASLCVATDVLGRVIIGKAAH
jgi:hypothetical protein